VGQLDEKFFCLLFVGMQLNGKGFLNAKHFVKERKLFYTYLDQKLA